MRIEFEWNKKNIVYVILLCILFVMVCYIIFRLLQPSAAMPDDWQSVNVALEVALSEKEVQLSAEIEVEQAPQLININRAAAFELELLPGIGPVKAKAIVDYRRQHGPFASIESLQDVPGIGPATYENLENFITVD